MRDPLYALLAESLGILLLEATCEAPLLVYWQIDYIGSLMYVLEEVLIG